MIDDSDGDGVADIDEIDHENNTGGDEADCDPDDGAEVCDPPDTADPVDPDEDDDGYGERDATVNGTSANASSSRAALAQGGPSWMRKQRKPGELGRLRDRRPAPATW